MPHFLLFLMAAGLLAITPGPGIFYVVSRTWASGRRDGLASSLGTMAGGLVHVAACVIGVSAIIMASAAAFAVLKLCGGLYLIYLGVQTFRAASREETLPAGEGVRGGGSAFRQGIVVEATNPKTAAFFLAFIPQFINLSAGHVPLQFLAMGIICVALNTGADLVAVLSAARLQRRLLERPQMFKRLRQGSGLLMVSLGAGVLAMKRG
jgi:threonine/homoserine/homoserine lactone efflux protein